MTYPELLNRRARSDQGSILVLALLVTLIILAIGLTAMWLSSSGMKMSANLTRRQEALYAAETGLSHARQLLRNATNWDNLMTLSSGCPGAPAVDANKGLVLCDTTTNTLIRDFRVLQNAPATTTKARWMANLRYTVFIRNDAAEIAGSGGSLTITDDNDWRVVIRSEGTGRDGLSFFAIEAVVSRASAILREENYAQLGGSAQNQNSGRAKIPLPGASSGGTSTSP